MHTFLRARIYQTPFNRITTDARFIPLPHFSTPSTPARRTKVEYSRQDSRLHNVACNVNPFISLPRPSPLPFLRPLFFPLICGIFSSSLHASISIFARSLRLRFPTPSFLPAPFESRTPSTFVERPLLLFYRDCRTLSRVTDAHQCKLHCECKKEKRTEGGMVEFTLYGGCANIC